MFLLDWYREYLTIRAERVCQNCEYLKTQLEIEQQFNKVLFEKLTKQPESLPITVPETVVPAPKHIPWQVRRQILEGQDKIAAQKLREAQASMKSPSGGIIADTKVAPPDDPEVLALEKEMDLIAKEREIGR